MDTADVIETQEVLIETAGVKLTGELSVPQGAKGVVVFAHGSGSGRFSSRNVMVANYLNQTGLATLLFDLLTPDEDVIDEETRQYRFDVELLAERLAGAIEFTKMCPRTKDCRIGLFGASTGAAAALIAAAERPNDISAVVSRGGRPDMAEEELERVRAPTLLVVGALDDVVVDLNQKTAEMLRCHYQITIIPGASHLFSEPGKLQQVAAVAGEWFEQYLTHNN